MVKKISAQVFSEIVTKVITVADNSFKFNQFRVYLEEEAVQQVAERLPAVKAIGDHEGRVFLLSVRQIDEWLHDKRASEKKARSIPGHTSYRPSATLTTDTCVVVIGSRTFCALVARIHMEEIVMLHPKLINILTNLCSLQICGAKGRVCHDDVLITSVRPDDKDHITYNLNWMADQVMRHAERPSHESVMRRLR